MPPVCSVREKKTFDCEKVLQKFETELVELIQQHRRFFFFLSSRGIFSRVLGVGDRVDWKVIGF